MCRSKSTRKASFWLSPIGFLGHFGREWSKALGIPGFWRKYRAESRGLSGKCGIKMVSPQYPNTPSFLFRWSALAKIAPFLEQGNLYNALDLTIPLYEDTALDVTPPNVPWVLQRISIYQCPSDTQEPINPAFGPTNY